MEFSGVMGFLKNKDSYWSCRGHEELIIPFDVLPSEYLSYSEYDIESGIEKRHRLINTLSNAKRSLDCQIDSLLIAFGLYGLAKKEKWNIPKKIEKLKELGIIAPRILNKINSVRNLVEHKFEVPNEEQVSDFLDVVALFNASTERYIYDFPRDSQIENDSIDDLYLDVRFNREESNIKIEARMNEIYTFIIDSSHDDYIEFINHYIKKFSKS
ncbi:hypothetical protein M3661_25810 [Paenibacillus sp. MER 180]|uniref:hypothetical protein n=1 Tax=Paenibacillus sp. MER 180 TaxID=2939570 RepID=UPI00203F8DDF|nr:hypothetical protein [Paenibacillus sp. MER 180]MCM3293525.1 hypothetical protein [Paenibacillus sp. MER 180]